MSELVLTGVEAWTVELSGVLPRRTAERAARGFELIEDNDGIEVGLLAFGMTGLALDAMPFPRFDYCEALWRIGVMLDGRRGWLAHTCDLDRRLIRSFGRRFIRYPVRSADIEADHGGDDWRVRISVPDVFSACLRPTEITPDPILPRPVVVRDGGQTFTVPWAEEPAPYRVTAEVVEVHDEVSTITFGDGVTWASSALLHRGRTHRCGFARRAKEA